MKFLIIYSHPNPKSFNHAILDVLVESLAEGQHEVRIRDLYSMEFDPVLKGSELVDFEKNIFPEDVKAEQEHIKWADVLIFICPIWWGGLTAQLRGYFDRVFSLNFAYAETDAGIEALLSDKKGLFISTIGAPENVYREMGMFKSMTQTIDEVIGGFCGMNMLEHKYFSSVGTCSDEERKSMLEEVKKIAKAYSSNTTEEVSNSPVKETKMGKKILIVDDEKEMLSALQKRLVDDGHDVTVEETAKGGLSKAKEINPDIIFLDILLPDMEGPEVAQLMQNDQELNTIPIVFLSGIIAGEQGSRKSEVKVKDRSYRALGKPFTYGDLKEEIEYILGPQEWKSAG